MSSLIRIACASLLVLAAFGGCNEKSDYCHGVPDDKPDCVPVDSGPDGCTQDDQCPGEVCDSASGECVQCTPEKAAACTGATPVCGADNSCGPCTEHTQCTASNACLPDGSCGDAANVAYVDGSSGSDTNECTQDQPCKTLTKGLMADKAYVKAHGTITDHVTIDNKNVTVLATPGAKLTPMSQGSLLTIQGTSNVSVYDLEIDGANATGANPAVYVLAGATGSLALTRVKVDNGGGDGVLSSASGGTLTVTQSTVSGNTGGGISASGGTLTVTQSTVSGNTGGGISVANATFIIIGNILFANGSTTGSVGGVLIQASQNAINRLDFNSFNKNQTQDGLGSAIQCVAGTFTARNNIMSDNGTLSNMAQVSGTCMHAYSIARPGTVPPGVGNSSDDPLFLNTTTGDLHVQSSSPAKGAADPNSDLTGLAATDLDGDARTSPADIGADELP